ncbi:Chondroitin sulfate ABC endolyase [Pontiella desulfatans]|uniref:Chondroitin sulfate ABC endolyase n=1 Tax=Pontiella desulfatans TaxID=2750659 RepID=A0A6C2U3G5_PONDE|nr:polysaccharide lyase family 8 super-sandwich domain-containing protein [Pontiella desulfatans]VGO14174.1 Chondroitin sulfate ABC endolyase [Pontiella desulfatans]
MKLLLTSAALFFLAAGGLQAQTIDFEGSVPANWSATAGSLAISSDHYRIGSDSLRWDWVAGDTLEVATPGIDPSKILDFYNHTMEAFVYNEASINEPLTIEFLDASGTVNYHFDFYLNYQGWRRISRSYRYDMQAISGSTTDIDKVVIHAPSTGSGTVFLDDWEFVRSRYTRHASRQMPDVSGYYSDTGYIDVDALAPNIPYAPATAGELADLTTLRTYLRNWFDGGTPNISNATTYYNSLNIVVNGNAIKGQVTTPQEADGHLLDLAQHFFHTGNSNSYEMAKNLLWHLNDLGYAGGSDFSYGWYDTRDYFQGLVLMLEYLPTDLRAELVDAAMWVFKARRSWVPEWPGDDALSSDHVYTNFRFQLGTLAFIEDDNEAVRQLKGFKQFLDFSNVPAKGTGDWIKPDGTGFHHWTHYNHYMYAFSSYADVLHALIGTQFQIAQESYENFRDMAYASLVMSTASGEYANSLCGRYPFSQPSPLNQGAFNNLAYAGGDVLGETADPMIASAYNRIHGDDSTLMANYPTETFQEGFWQFNWSPVAVYRKDNWVATAHGLNNVFWGTETYSGENRCGRYQSYGALEIMYPGGFTASGFHINGWDWNRPPGTTTKVLPHADLNPPGSRSDERAASTFAGGLRFNEIEAGRILDRGEIGMYATDFQQDGSLTPTHDGSFRFRKSWFFIDDYIVCLGSDIECTDASNDIITTLFQGKLNNTSDPIVLDNSSITAFPYSNTVVDGDHWLLDAYGTGYHIDSSQGLKITRQNQTSLQQDGTGTTSGNFATAWFDHGKAPSGAGYEYVVKPATDSAGMQAFSATMSGKPYEVLQKDSAAHVVRFGDVEAHARFTAAVNSLDTVVKGSSEPCLVMVGGSNPIKLTMVNPDQGLEARSYDDPAPVPVELTLRGTWTITDADTGVSLLSTNGTETTLLFMTDDLEPFDVELLDESVPVEERTFEFNPIHDAHTVQSNPDTNYGVNTKLAVRSDKYDSAMNGYLMFDADTEGMIPLSATLKLYCSHNPIVLSVLDVADTTWTEGALTWNNQPPMGAVADSRSVDADVWETFDVTASVSGDGKLSFGLISNEASYSNVDAKEGANAPVLEVVAVSLGGDKDADGLPNGWEFGYFGGATNATASADDDGDGFDNLAEFIAGTNPTNEASFFAASSTHLPSGFVVEWSAVSNREYGVWHSVSLTNAFTNLAAGILFPQNSYTDTLHAGESEGFYQVDVRPVP